MELRADCSRCFGLCCVALPFAASADFAIDKAAGEPCPKLERDFRCGIHAHLREEGFRGCAAFDCFGAGQSVAQGTFGGRDWREHPEVAREMFAVFPVMRQLHELLWHLTEALSLPQAEPLRDDLRRLADRVEEAAAGSSETLAALDPAPLRREASRLLSRAGDLVRAEAPGPRADHSGADLLGARLSGADLRGADLRGACLIAAELTSSDLRLADLLGADLRAADLSAADLSGALFLTQSQVDAANGDGRTILPGSLTRPGHWR